MRKIDMVKDIAKKSIGPAICVAGIATGVVYSSPVLTAVSGVVLAVEITGRIFGKKDDNKIIDVDARDVTYRKLSAN